MSEVGTHTTPTGVTFPTPDPDVAAWMRPALMWLAAHRSGDPALSDATLDDALGLAPAKDVACGALAIAARLLAEVDDPEAYLTDLGLRIAEALADSEVPR